MGFNQYFNEIHKGGVVNSCCGLRMIMKNISLLLIGSLADSAAVYYAILLTDSAATNSKVDQLKGELSAVKNQIEGELFELKNQIKKEGFW